MTEAGLAAGIDFLDEPFEVPADILAAIREDAETLREFEALPEHYVRIRVGWIDMARDRPEIFAQRLGVFLKMTKQGKRFGMER